MNSEFTNIRLYEDGKNGSQKEYRLEYDIDSSPLHAKQSFKLEFKIPKKHASAISMLNTNMKNNEKIIEFPY